MKKNCLSLLSVSLLGIVVGLNGMDESKQQAPKITWQDMSTYKGTKITPQTIVGLAQMPETLVQVVKQWAEEREESLEQLIPTTQEVALTEEEKRQEHLRFKAVMNNLTWEEYQMLGSFPQKLEGENGKVYKDKNGKMYWVKFSGPTHKRHNLETYNGKGWGAAFTEEDKKTATFQTASGAVGVLKCQQVIEENQITGFRVPKTYVAQVPGRKPIEEGASDENTLLVQEDRGQEYVPIKDHLKELEQVSTEFIGDTYKVIKGGVLWDIRGNGLVNTKDHTLGQSDLEQPNNQNPEVFAYNAPQKFDHRTDDPEEYTQYKLEHDIQCGICGFAALLKAAHDAGYDVSDQLKQYQQLVQNDPQVAQFSNAGLTKQARECVNFENLN